jgi:hypothetical protein
MTSITYSFVVQVAIGGMSGLNASIMSGSAWTPTGTLWKRVFWVVLRMVFYLGACPRIAILAQLEAFAEN